MDFYTPMGIHVYFKEPIENKEVDAERVIAKVEGRLPEHLLNEVEMVIFGYFDEFIDRQLNAFYEGGTLYITPDQSSEDDLFDDIIHEISHSLESPHGALIYHDKKIEQEFLNKREHLHKILWELGYKLPENVFLEPEYNKEFDMFLLDKVGYDKLSIVTQGVFINPYAATSLREYFATGFTEYFLDSNHSYLKQVSPQLYRKLLLLQDPEKLDSE
tara:strand:- start:166 stop:813 length:648 start_codon:yes stop_codon:yes gene_type:complete